MQMPGNDDNTIIITTPWSFLLLLEKKCTKCLKLFHGLWSFYAYHNHDKWDFFQYQKKCLLIFCLLCTSNLIWEQFSGIYWMLDTFVVSQARVCVNKKFAKMRTLIQQSYLIFNIYFLSKSVKIKMLFNS